jgi:hypothetical protein
MRARLQLKDLFSQIGWLARDRSGTDPVGLLNHQVTSLHNMMAWLSNNSGVC